MSVIRSLFWKLKVPNKPMNIIRLFGIFFALLYIVFLLLFCLDYSDLSWKVNKPVYVPLFVASCIIVTMWFSINSNKPD